MLEYYRFKVIHNLFLKGKTEEACMQLRELQKRYVDLCEENAVLKANAREYEDILFLARNFVFDGSFYWLITGNIKQGPFCPNCYSRDGQLVRITEVSPRRCNNCGEVFKDVRRTGGATVEGSSVRALEQAQAVSSIRAMAAMEQLAQSQVQMVHDELAAQDSTKPRGKAKIIPFTGQGA